MKQKAGWDLGDSNLQSCVQRVEYLVLSKLEATRSLGFAYRQLVIDANLLYYGLGKVHILL